MDGERSLPFKAEDAKIKINNPNPNKNVFFCLGMKIPLPVQVWNFKVNGPEILN